jgi:hypothetical protein
MVCDWQNRDFRLNISRKKTKDKTRGGTMGKITFQVTVCAHMVHKEKNKTRKTLETKNTKDKTTLTHHILVIPKLVHHLDRCVCCENRHIHQAEPKKQKEKPPKTKTQLKTTQVSFGKLN